MAFHNPLQRLSGSSGRKRATESTLTAGPCCWEPAEPTPGKRQGHRWASRTGLPGQGEPPRTPRAIVSEHQGAAEPLHPQAAPPRCRANPLQLHTDSFSELPRDLQALGKHFEELTNYKRGKKKTTTIKEKLPHKAGTFITSSPSFLRQRCSWEAGGPATGAGNYFQPSLHI